MSLVKITQFAPRDVSPETISNLKSSSQDTFTLGADVKSKDIQIISNSEDADDSKSPLSTAATSALGKPHTTFHIQLDGPAFGPNGAATAKVIEHAQSWFPLSTATPDFQRKIESDFARFDKLFMPGTVGHVGMQSGWLVEEQTHPDLKEKAKSFICVRGWESMEMFQRSMSENEGFKEAIGILHAWKAPFKMVSAIYRTAFTDDGADLLFQWHVEKLDSQSSA